MRSKLLIITSLAALLAVSCSQESAKTLYASQESRIETSLNSQLSADESGTMHVVSNKGSERLVIKEGEGEALTGSGTVTFRYAGFVLTSTTLATNNLFATNITEIAKKAGWLADDDETTTYDPVVENMSEKNLITGLRNGLIGVKAGEECTKIGRAHV